MCVCSQRALLHPGDQRRPAFPGEPRAGLHPEQDRVLPNEHPRAQTLHLPLSSWRERAQHAGSDRRRLGPVHSRERGGCLHSKTHTIKVFFNILLGLDLLLLQYYFINSKIGRSFLFLFFNG